MKKVINSRCGDAIDALDQSKTEAPLDVEAGRAAYDSANSLAEKRIAEIRAAKSNYKPGDGGIVYYVSNHGDNMNNGTTPETAKATVNRINTLKAGDVVLLERGGLWREAFKTVSGVTYSAYGEGDKPMIYASPENGADESKWKLLDGTDNIWVYETEMMDVGNIIFNEGEIYGYKALPYYENGQFVVKAGGEAFNVRTGLDCDLKFFSKADSLFSAKDLPVANTENVGEIYLRCDKGNPGRVYSSIEFLIRRNGIGLAGTDVIIDNLCIKYVGAHGIGGGTVGNVIIRNCELGWIGGGIQFYNTEKKSITRYGNGIEVYGGCDSYTIENCYIYDCYDAGITHQFQKGGTNAVKENNVTYQNNVIERCAYNIEYFMGKVDSGNADRIMRNINIKNNILRFAGKSYGERPHSVHIMGWEHRNEAYDFVIERNTFVGAENRVFYIGADNADWLPSFRGNTYIQKYSGQFAHYGVNGKCAEVAYSEDIRSQLFDILGEADAKIFFIMEEKDVK